MARLVESSSPPTTQVSITYSKPKQSSSSSTNCIYDKIKSVLTYISNLFHKIWWGSPSIPKRKYLDRKIPSKDLDNDWQRIKSKGRGTNHSHLSHLREVYIGPESFLGKKSIVKISSKVDRTRKGSNNAWPHAEEVAYKICKLFQWDSVPKTKVLHGEDLLTPSPKYQKYADLQESMTKRKSKQKVDEQTFTFQAYVKGKTLPRHTKRTQPVSRRSFQTTYLLDMILGKNDARADNTMYNPKTRQLFEIDNESLGLNNYAPKGVLREFKKQRHKALSDQVLNDVLTVDLTKLQAIEAKYKPRDLDLLNAWRSESKKSAKRSPQELESYWLTIRNNLHHLREAIQKLRNMGEQITISSLEKTYVSLQKELRKRNFAKQK